MNTSLWKNSSWICASILMLLLCAVISLSWGEIFISPLSWASLPKNGMETAILLGLRLPRTLAAICIGGMLSLSGCLLQGLFKNPLVEPYTLGISGGASLGVAIAFTSGIGLTAGTGLCALLGAAAVSMLLLFYFRVCHSVENLLLVGIMTGILCSAATTLLMSLSSPEDMTRILYWTMGSLEGCNLHGALLAAGFSVGGLVLAILLSQRINILSMGLETARSMGVNTALLIPVLLSLTALLTAVSVALAGIFGFVGLFVPHILRRIAGNDYRRLIPLSFLGGGIFLLLCDFISRILLYPSQLPIGVVSGILGGGLFVYLLLKSHSRSR